MRKAVGGNPDVAALFEQALADLRRAGAELVEIDFEPDDEDGRRRIPRAAIRAARGPRRLPRRVARRRSRCARSTRSSPSTRPMPAEEMRWFGQEIFLTAAKTTDRAAYEAGAGQFAAARRRGRDRQAARRAPRQLPRRAHRRPRLDDGPRQRRQLRRLDRRGQPGGDRRLSAPVGADGRGARPAGRAVDDGRKVERCRGVAGRRGLRAGPYRALPEPRFEAWDTNGYTN